MISRKFIRQIFFYIGLFALAFQNAPAQEEKPKPLSLNDILAKLTFTSRIDKTGEQINDKLIKQINKRKVDFELSKNDEQQIKKRGGTIALINAINENYLEEVVSQKMKEQRECIKSLPITITKETLKVES